MIDQKPMPSWRDVLLSYTKRHVVVLFFLGFSAGLPYLLVFSTLSAWLADVEVKRATIGFLSWVGITFSIKVFWAPVIDRLPLPGLTRWLGRRRSWMLLAQVVIALALVGMAYTDPREDIIQLAQLAVIVAFASATQDISIDAFRIESADAEYQGVMAAMYIFGYRVALLVSGAGAFYIAEYYSWSDAYLAMAALMGVGMLTALYVAEPQRQDNSDVAEVALTGFSLTAIALWFRDAVVGPFREFFQRNGQQALLILTLIGIYKLSDITMGVMANPFYLDIGFSKLDIANIGKVFGFVMSIVGSALGGLLVVRYGIMRPLLLGAVLVATTNLFFVLLSQIGPDLTMLAITISADNISGGLASAVFIAYLSSLTNTAYTATQYALFSSLMTLPAKMMGGFSGVVVEGVGYSYFFLYASCLGLPAILLLLWMMHQARSVHT